MVVLGRWAVFYEQGTPVSLFVKQHPPVSSVVVDGVRVPRVRCVSETPPIINSYVQQQLCRATLLQSDFL